MKKFLCLILAACMLALPACSKKGQDASNNGTLPNGLKEEVEKPDSVQLISNGDFENSMTNWMTFFSGGAAGVSVSSGELGVDITNTGSLEYAVQVYQDTLELHKGDKYRISFDARSTIDRSVEVRMQINGEDYHAYTSSIINLTGEMKTYTIDFTMEEATDLAPRFAINMGVPVGYTGDPLPEHQIYFDNISVALTDDSGKVVLGPNKSLRDININQIGYNTDYEKIAVVRSKDNLEGKKFEVINTSNNKVAYKGKISKGVVNRTANEMNYYIDFSNLKKSGTYKVRVDGHGESYNFKIGSNVYENVNKALVKMLYLQRCGMTLDAKYAGDFAHEACHTSEALVYGTEDKTIDVSGGWHDAGDYGRYVVPGAKAVMDLLLAYQFNPLAFGDDVGIPESGNGTPDILDEARWELQWMLKMQDSETGGVHHKVTCMDFPGTVMPQEETDQLIVSPVSYAATGDFSAVMARAYTTYKSIDADFANKCLEASKKAWDYISSAEKLTGFTNPGKIVTGEYGDGKVEDELAWASVELYRVTNEDKYHEAFKKNYSNLSDGFGWADVGGYGAFTYLSIPENKTDKALRDKVHTVLKASADYASKKVNSDGYKVSLGSSYPWGSNMVVANDAMVLIMMSKIDKTSDYIKPARHNVDYIFGTNPMSISYVTGFGSYSPQKAHHRLSMSVRSEMPGMLVGGPDSNLEDPYSKSVFKDTPASKCYVDNTEAYSVNEITIYWNSPLIFAINNLR